MTESVRLDDLEVYLVTWESIIMLT